MSADDVELIDSLLDGYFYECLVGPDLDHVLGLIVPCLKLHKKVLWIELFPDDDARLVSVELKDRNPGGAGGAPSFS